MHKAASALLDNRTAKLHPKAARTPKDHPEGAGDTLFLAREFRDQAGPPLLSDQMQIRQTLMRRPGGKAPHG